MADNAENFTVDEMFKRELSEWLDNIGIDANMIPSCEKAIEFCNAGKWREPVELPEGTIWISMETKERLNTAPAREIARWCVLHKWITRNYL